MHDLVHDLARSVVDEELIVFYAKKQSSTSRHNCCRYALLANYSEATKIPTILPAKLRALHFLDCSKLDLDGGAFSFTKCLRVLDLSECSIRKFPSSIGQLKQLRFLIAPELEDQIFPKSITQLSKLQYLDLHGSSQISAVPRSISKVECLMHLDLSGCCSVEFIPEALCGLTKLQCLDLSNCSRLGVLPEAIGSLTELQYLNLSGLYIEVLPESFRELRNLVHLDLSSCPRVEGISETLGCLTKLRYLNLSSETIEFWFSCRRHGPSYQRRYLESINALINLEHLDLSSNSGLFNLTESLGNLKNLHTLNLSGCSHLTSIPQSLGNLKSLHTLNLSSCRGLASLPESIGSIASLEFILVEGCSNELKEYMRKSSLKNNPISLPHFVVHAEEGDFRTNLHLLENIDPEELEISCLENVRSIGEVRGIELLEKQNLLNLTFHWTRSGNRVLEDKDVLGELVPPRDLKSLKLQGYGSTCFPAWLMGIDHHLPNLTKIELNDLPRCRDLPPLGQLPNLEELHLRELCSITKINGDICGGKGAFRRLSTFTLKKMEQLEEWNTTYIGEDGEFMFPMLDRVSIEDCQKLRLKPRPPIFHKWVIERSDKVISSWGERDHARHSFSSTPCTSLVIKDSKVPSDKWRLLHHLPTLQELEIFGCENLTSLPDSMRHLASLRSLDLHYCDAISVPPDWLGDLTSLEGLKVEGCRSIMSLPQCIQQLTNLQKIRIVDNSELKRWCIAEENKMKLAHIKDIVSALRSCII